MKRKTLKEAIDNVGIHEADSRMDSLIDQKQLHAFRAAATAIMDDLIQDGFEAADVIEYLTTHIYSSEAENAKGISDFEKRQDSEMSSHDASLYEEPKEKQEYIYENAGVSQKGFIEEAYRLRTLAGL